MLPRQSKKPSSFLSWIKKGATIVFVAEAASFGVSYLLWYRMNTNREFRHYMHNNFPAILDGYYQIGEYMSGSSGPSNSIRNIDAEYWRHQKPSTSN